MNVVNKYGNTIYNYSSYLNHNFISYIKNDHFLGKERL